MRVAKKKQNEFYEDMDIDSDFPIDLNTKKNLAVSNEEKLKIFRERMSSELDSSIIHSVDLPLKHVPEEVAEYICDISEFMRDTEDEFLPEYGYMKK